MILTRYGVSVDVPEARVWPLKEATIRVFGLAVSGFTLSDIRITLHEVNHPLSFD